VAGRPAAVLLYFLARTRARLDSVSQRFPVIVVLYVLCVELGFLFLHAFRGMLAFAFGTTSLDVTSYPGRPSSSSDVTVLREDEVAIVIDLIAGVLLLPSKVVDGTQRRPVRHKM
jgi:hypothetical protein